MPTQPTAQQLDQRQQALLNAFSHDQLTRLVRHEFDRSLDQISPVVGKRDLTVIVEHLVAYVASLDHGLKQLLDAATTANPNHGGLNALAQAWSTQNFAPLPLPADHPSITATERAVAAGGNITDAIIITGDNNTVHPLIGSSPSSPSSSPPLHRPPRTQHFQDRKTELAQLLDELQPGHVATLCGPGGMGKSALAAEAVCSLAPENEPPERFPDGIFFHSFYNQPQAAIALEQLALSFGEEPRPNALFEVFGFPSDDLSGRAMRYRKHKLCPFNNRVPNCTKDKANDPLGVCSIY